MWGDSKTQQETIPNLFLQASGFADDLSSIKMFTVRVSAIYNQSSVCVFFVFVFFFPMPICSLVLEHLPSGY